jgi:ABC-2 type transport system permease protein
MGLFLWILPDNILSNGYANLDQLFSYGPRILLLLIPAITMRSFADEKKTGTLEILSTKPISDLSIVLGKFFAGVVLLLFSLLPTLLYYYTIHQLSEPVGNIDTGAIIGSYLGLFLVGCAYLSIGLFASSITDNQIVAFILGLFLCFFFFILLEYLSGISGFGDYQWIFQLFSLEFHYISISRGIIDTRDVIYFLSFTFIFIQITKFILERRRWA